MYMIHKFMKERERKIVFGIANEIIDLNLVHTIIS